MQIHLPRSVLCRSPPGQIAINLNRIGAVPSIYAKCIDCSRYTVRMPGKFFHPKEHRTFRPETISYLCACLMRSPFFHAMLCYTKVELSKIALYYTRALEAKQNSGFSLN
jgi:hypothetical protein